jgi:hypothetical protein
MTGRAISDYQILENPGGGGMCAVKRSRGYKGTRRAGQFQQGSGHSHATGFLTFFCGLGMPQSAITEPRKTR